MNNFYNEPSTIKELNRMETKIPKPAIKKCISATLIVLLGNAYGKSFDAIEPTEDILQKLFQSDQISIISSNVYLTMKKFFKKFFQWLNLISFLSVGTTTKKRRFYHRISASITILVFLRGKGIRCPSSLCFRMDRTMTHTFGLCESLFLVEISGIEPLTS